MPRSDAISLYVRRRLADLIPDQHADDDLLTAVFIAISEDLNVNAGRSPFEHVYSINMFDTDWSIVVTGAPADD